MDQTQLAQEPNSGLVYRWQPAQGPTNLNFLMFHGLTGNEDVMWVLASALPEGAFIASPRAPFSLSVEGGYSWVDPAGGDGYQRGDFSPGLEAAHSWLRGMVSAHQIELERTILVGFSQGSALAFLLADQLVVPAAGIVSLAAFLPEGEFDQLRDMPIFWGHGSQDQTITAESARQDVDRLRQLGAQVQYCEADVGHKVGVECMRGLKGWLEQIQH
jgi:predicted esterase